MSNPKPNENREPVEAWLPPLLLKFVVLLVFACVIAGAMVGVLQHDLDSNRLWLIIGGMAALLLLLGIDRLAELELSPKGLKAKLTQAQAKALQQVGTLENLESAEEAEAEILEAKDAQQVQEALDKAVKLNVTRVVERVEEAIHGKRKLFVRYRPDPQAPVQAYHVAPLDIKPGKTPRTQMHDYLWVYSFDHGRFLSLRLERVVGVELSEETFDPASVTAEWKEPWNVAREW